MSISKCFVLVVGNHTDTITKGSCQFCSNYVSNTWYRYFGLKQCNRNGNVDFRSFVRYECEMALKDYSSGELKKIVVLYNSVNVDKSKCPDCLKKVCGITHIPMKLHNQMGQIIWNYQGIKFAIA